tara:strand:+ start:182 stop:370 length:189 start_codon:yes stop_codon:yes gene_type:complete
MTLDKIKNIVNKWSNGLPLEGETKQELKESVEEIKYKLSCEISDQARKIDNMINQLEIEEGC